MKKKLHTTYSRYFLPAFIFAGLFSCFTKVNAQRTVTFSGVNTNFVSGNNVTVTKVSTSNSSQTISCVSSASVSYLDNNSATGYFQFGLSLATEKIDSIIIVWKSGGASQVVPVIFGQSITFGTYNTVSNVLQVTNGGFGSTSVIAASGGTNCNGGDTVRFPTSANATQVLIARSFCYDATAYAINTKYSGFYARLNNSTSTGYTTQISNANTEYYGSITLYISNISAPLPVTFADVQASQKNGGITVQWSANTEVNTDKYVVEKSTDGSSFTDAASIAAKATSTTANQYSWFDATPSASINFYRIKAVDKDGSFTYSSTIKMNNDATNLGSLIIAPNPIINRQINLQLSSLNKGNYSLNVYSITGQLVFTKPISYEGGVSSFILALPATINKGMYSVQVSNETTKISKQVLIQ